MNRNNLHEHQINSQHINLLGNQIYKGIYTSIANIYIFIHFDNIVCVLSSFLYTCNQ